MSQSYREDCNDHKRVREGIVDQRPIGGTKNKAKPVIVEYRGGLWNPKDWQKWKAYRTEAEALTAIENHKRKHGFYEMRIRGKS